MTANKVQYGLSHVHYAVATEGSGGALTYATPVALPGAVSMTFSANESDNPFYADNGIYYDFKVNNGYTGTLELAQLPKSFRTAVLGEIEDSKGVLFEKAGQPTVEFALLFQFEGDQSATKYAFLRCTASRPAINGNTTTDSVTPQTETLNLTVMPRIDSKYVRNTCPADADNYATFFNAVYDTPTSA